MEEFSKIIELSILALTLLVTVYFSYKSARIQQKVLTIKSTEEYSQKINKTRRELEDILGFSIKHGASIDPDKLLTVEQEPDKRIVLIEFLNLYESMARGINLGAYDGNVFRVARGTITTLTYYAFENFILQYRAKYNRPNAWLEFEKLAKKWS